MLCAKNFLLLCALPLALCFSARSMASFDPKGSSSSRLGYRQKDIVLPERLIVGYANWNECDQKIVEAVKQGVNVVMWFSINLAVDHQGQPTITNGPDMDCVADKVRQIRELGLPTVHIISIGGWNAPHPDTTNSPETTYENWDHWNRHVAARPDVGFMGFDGFDWDIEGNDDPNNQYNHFTPQCLDTMGRFSQLAKERGNYIVSMAPAESYLDPTYPTFDRSLLHAYPEWQPIIPDFDYHGRNTYAYLLARYGTFSSEAADAAAMSALQGEQGEQGRECGVQMGRRAGDCLTFDFVTVQLYEGYSHAEYNITQLRTPPAQYLAQFAQQMQAGWEVDFSDMAQFPVTRITVPKTQLVVGLANGWAGDGKFLMLYPEEVAEGYKVLEEIGQEPRGFAFWNILDEGAASPRRPQEPVWMAKGLNRFLHTREPEV